MQQVCESGRPGWGGRFRTIVEKNGPLVYFIGRLVYLIETEPERIFIFRYL